MKKYFLSSIEIRNVNILKECLKENNLEFIGIQRSLDHLSQYSGENCIEDYVYGSERYVNKEMNAEFELPLFNNLNVLECTIIIKGTGLMVEEDDDIIEEYINIENVKIKK